MIAIPVQKLSKNAKMPVRANACDTGWDVFARTCEFFTCPGWRTGIAYGIGLSFAVPHGYDLQIRARSSVFRTGLVLAGGIGTIDSGYRGEVKAVFYANEGAKIYELGDRIAQLVLSGCPAGEYVFTEVDELPPPPDGRTGGFGSTGK